MSELPEHRLRRLRMRSWRRGTKEMDLILGPYGDAQLAVLKPVDIEGYEALLEENDQDLYQWVTGQAPTPERHVPCLQKIRDFHGII